MITPPIELLDRDDTFTYVRFGESNYIVSVRFKSNEKVAFNNMEGLTPEGQRWVAEQAKPVPVVEPGDDSEPDEWFGGDSSVQTHVTAAITAVAEPAAESKPIEPTEVVAPSPRDVVRHVLDRRYAAGQLIELRAPGVVKDGRTIVMGGLYDDREALIRDVATLLNETNAPAIYTQLQEIRDTAAYRARATNRLGPWLNALSDSEVSRYRWLLVDIDTVRSPEFSKSSSTDSEKAAGRQLAEKLRRHLTAKGIPTDLIDSGNSNHLMARIDLDATPENSLLLKKVLESLALGYNTADAVIDTSVYNRSRICKLAGTLVRKGENTPERPWRWSGVIEEAAELKVVSREALLDLAGLTEETAPKPRIQVQADSEEIQWSLDWLQAFLEHGGLEVVNDKPYDGGFIFVLKECPFEHKSGHHSGECHVGVNKEAKLCFACKHDSCSGVGWKQFRAGVEKQKGSFCYGILKHEPATAELSEKRSVEIDKVAVATIAAINGPVLAGETSAQEATDIIGRTENNIPIFAYPQEENESFEDIMDIAALESAGDVIVEYPDPGRDDLVSLFAAQLVEGTTMPLAYARETLKNLTNQLIDGYYLHPAWPTLSLRGFHINYGESTTGKTTVLDWILGWMGTDLERRGIWARDLLKYGSRQYFVRWLSREVPTGKDGKPKWEKGNPRQFLYVKEGNRLAAEAMDKHFKSIFALLTDLYDQTDASTGSFSNDEWVARDVKVGAIINITPTDYRATFEGKGTIGAGSLPRWTTVAPPRIRSAKDWIRLPQEILAETFNRLRSRLPLVAERTLPVSPVIVTSQPVLLTEEEGAKEIRLATKKTLDDAGKIGLRLSEYFVREQVNRAVFSIAHPNVMTAADAERIVAWTDAQLKVRAVWPPDAGNPVERHEVTMRRTVIRHLVTETKLKDACHYYRPGSGGAWAFQTALANLLKCDIKCVGVAGQRRVPVFCPRWCSKHVRVRYQ
jgi:hypothetical protein